MQYTCALMGGTTINTAEKLSSAAEGELRQAITNITGALTTLARWNAKADAAEQPNEGASAE